MKTYKKYRIATLLAGIATATIIVFSQLFYFQAATYCQKKAETEQKETKDKTNHQTYYSIPSNTISSVSNIEINEGISFVLEILFENDAPEANTDFFTITSSLFQTLFRFVISPNAP